MTESEKPSPKGGLMLGLVGVLLLALPVVAQDEAALTRGVSVMRTSDWATGPRNEPVPFDLEEYDDDDLWSAEAPTVLGPMPASYAGRRAVIYATAIWSFDETYAELKVFRNGVEDAPVAVVEIASNRWNSGVELTSRPLVLEEGDYFELIARTGDEATALYAPDYSITFSIEVRPY